MFKTTVMLRSLLLILTLLPLSLTRGHAQSELVIRDQGDQVFYLILNGEQKNDEPQPNWKSGKIESGNYKVKVLFKDSNISPLETDIHLPDHVKRTYLLEPLDSTHFELSLLSELRIQPKKEQSDQDQMGSVAEVQPAKAREKEPRRVSADSSLITSYDGPRGCASPMNGKEFQNLLKAVSSKTFEEDKVSTAKNRIRDRCLVSRQVKALISVFEYEDNKLDFAKYAFGKTFDQGNYLIVSKAFDFDSSQKDLKSYLQEH